MGLMDKVRAQATQLAQKTQETARDSKVKFDQAQAKRRGEVMLRNLGAMVYADRTGRGTPDSAAEIDRLVTEISSHEAEHEISLAREPTDNPQADVPGAAPTEPAAEATAAYGSAPEAPPAPAGQAEAFPPSAPTSFPPDAGPPQG
jgi:hypothetical protein